MNVLGLIFSIVYIFFIILISTIISKSHSELSRKVVHIGVCNWWIIKIYLNLWKEMTRVL